VLMLNGLALALGGALYAVAWIGFGALGRDPAAPQWLPLHLLVIFGSIGIAVGLPGVHALQERQAGTLGLLAVTMLVVGYLVAGVARQSVEAFAIPALGSVPPGAGLLVAIASPLLFIGMVTLGVVVLRAGVFPAWLGIGLIVAVLAGAVAAFVPLPAALRWSVSALAGLAFVGLGLIVIAAAREG
jgi:hypothetical protein